MAAIIFKIRSLGFSVGFLLLAVLPIENAFGYYEYDNFSALTARWNTNCYYGRDGFVLPNASSSTVIQFLAGGALKYTGNPNTVGISRNGYWKGRTTYNTNLYNASATQPFGFEIMRTNCKIFQGGTGDARYQSEVGVWLFVWKTGVTGNTEWEIFDDFAEFFDFNGDFGSPNHLAQIGAFVGTARLLNVTNARGVLGNTTNLSNVILWDYQSTGARLNTNKIGFRITHDCPRRFPCAPSCEPSPSWRC